MSRTRIHRIGPDDQSQVDDVLAVEQPLQIRLRYWLEGVLQERDLSVTMRTPGHDEELTVGFLFTEGIIRGAEEVSSVAIGDNSALVTLAADTMPSLPDGDRYFTSNSGCGVCGKSSIGQLRTSSVFDTTIAAGPVNASVFYALQSKISDGQRLFHMTGGIHASAVFSADGELLLLREDIGRHNALDKVIGNLLVNQGLPASSAILFLSGRAGFELVQKAYMAGFKTIAAVGAPSSLAVDIAKEKRITLVGFLRSDRFNVYSGIENLRL